MGQDGGVRRDRTTAYLALAGVLTGLAGIVTSQATVWALRATNGPVTSVASAVRDLTPGPLAIKLVHLVGHLDKPLLVSGTLVVLVVICAAAGILTRRHPLLSDLVFFALALVGLASVVRLQDSALASGLAVVVGLVTWIVTLRFLTAPLAAAPAPTSPASTDPGSPEPGPVGRASRRAFLLRAGGPAAVVVFVGAAGGAASRSRRRVEQARKLLRLPVRRGAAPA